MRSRLIKLGAIAAVGACSMGVLVAPADAATESRARPAIGEVVSGQANDRTTARTADGSQSVVIDFTSAGVREKRRG